jgi:hypothetical protein
MHIFHDYILSYVTKNASICVEHAHSVNEAAAGRHIIHGTQSLGSISVNMQTVTLSVCYTNSGRRIETAGKVMADLN